MSRFRAVAVAACTAIAVKVVVAVVQAISLDKDQLGTRAKIERN
jgi:hypothetical protein